MLNTNLIVGSEKLFQANNILEQFSTDHHILTFKYNPEFTPLTNSKILYKAIRTHLSNDYAKMTFMGHETDCNLLYELYKDKGIIFDAAIFVNYSRDYDNSLYGQNVTQQALSEEKTKIYSFYTTNSYNQRALYTESHQYIPSMFKNIRSKRLAQEIYGCTVYGGYQMTSLGKSPTVIL